MTALVRAPLCGEILGAADTVTVIAALHPLSPARETLQAPAGLSIAEIVDLALLQAPGAMVRAIVVSIGPDPVPRDRWQSIRPKAGTAIVLRARPAGGAGGLFKSIALLAVAILTAFIAPYLTPILGTFGTAIVTAAITVGAGLLLNALFPVNAKKADTGQVYSVAGNQNLATPYQPIPALHGRMRVYPRYGGSAYTEFEGDNQVLRLLYVWGYGPLDVTEIKIGETPIEAYHDVQIETFYGYPGDPEPTLYPTTVVQKDLNVEVKQVDGWTTRTTSEDVTEWAIDFAAPNGLSATKTSGEVITLAVSITIEQSVAYAEDWQPVETLVLSGRSTKPIRLTVRRPVASGTYDLRWRRATADTDGNPKLISNTVVTAMRSYRAAQPITFAKPLAITAIRIRATSQLSGIVDNLNAVCTSRVASFDGTAWVDDVPSSNPADQLIRALQGPANPRPIVGARIDWLTIQEWRAWCLPRGYAYNKLHTERQSVLATAQDIASAGRAAIVFRDGKWSVVWDAPDAPVVQHFTPRNSESFRGKRSYRRLPHGYRIKFQNQARGWRDDEIIAYADGYSAANATLFEEVEFPGQTDHALNWRHGRYHDAQVRLRPEEYSLRVGIEHLIATRGDRVRVTHPVPAWGLASGRVVGVDGDTVYLDDTVTMVAGKAYCIRFRLSDETGLVRLVATTPGEGSAVQLVEGEGLPTFDDVFMFGEVGQESVVLRLKSITPGEDYTADLVMVDDAPEIALADQGDPPDVVDVPATTDPTARQPTGLRVVEGRGSAADGYPPTVTFLWATPAGGPPVDHFEVALKEPGDAAFALPISTPATQRSYSWSNLTPGSTSFRARTFFTDGTVSVWSASTVQVLSWSTAPADVTGLKAATFAGQTLFSWDAPDRIVATLELRYSPATSGATWEAAAALVSRSDGTSISAPFAAGTYLAKFVNGGGVYSETAAAIVVTAGTSAASQPIAEIFDFQPFGGTHAGTFEANGGVRLALDGAGALIQSGTYQPAETIVLDGVYVMRISGDILAHGLDLTEAGSAPDIYGVDPGSWAAILEGRSTLNDPASATAVWTEWAPVTAGEVSARGLAVRVRLESLADGISPVVELVHLRADIDARTERGVAVAVPAAGRRIDFVPAFAGVPAIVVTGRDFASGDRLEFSDRSSSGFTLTIRDSGGTAVARGVDFIASGYGRRIS